MFDLNRDLLPDYDITDVNYYYVEGERIANTSVGLFKKEKGRILRLSSFELSPSNIPANFNAQKVGTTVNPLATGGFYKIKVDKSGIFKINCSVFKR